MWLSSLVPPVAVRQALRYLAVRTPAVAKKALPKQYKAPKGSKREKQLRRAAMLYKTGNKKAAFALREKMEAAVRKKRKKK